MNIETIMSTIVNDFSIIMILMLADLVTGVWNSLKSGNQLTSNRLKSSATKLIIYFLIVSIAVVCSEFGTEGAKTIITGYVAIVESLSILENLGDIFPTNRILGSITNKMRILKNKNSGRQ